MKPEYKALAQRSLLLATAPADVLEDVLSHCRERHLERGATVFLQGEPAAAIYIVAEGWVKLYRVAPNGTETVVAVFTHGASFGEAVAFRGDAYPVSAQAVTDSTLLRIEADAFLRHLRAAPELAIAILSATFAHLNGLVGQIEQLKSRTAAQRVAEFLLDLAGGSAGSCEVALPYDKVLIAGRLGMKPESLSRAFSRLKTHGVLIHKDVAMIQDVAVLRSYVGKDATASWGGDA